VAFDLKSTGNSSIYPADLTITNVGAVRIGKVWTRAEYGNPGAARGAGAVRIGANTAQGRAGQVEIAEILSSFAAEFSAYSAGAMTIDSSSDVLIWDGAGNYGNLASYTAGRANVDAAPVTVRHHGNFAASNILTYSSVKAGANILLDGDVLGLGASGGCAVRSLQSYTTKADVSGGAVDITNYVDVTISDGVYTYGSSRANGGRIGITATGNIAIGAGGLQSYMTSGNDTGNGGAIQVVSSGGGITVTGSVQSYKGGTAGSGGAVTMTCPGDLTVHSNLNLNAGTDANDGNLTLTSSGGAIRLASLNLGLMGWAKLDAAANTTITGVLTNFTAGSTDLRTPAGQLVLYNPQLNPHLGGLTYNLTNHAATGPGGLLTPGLPAISNPQHAGVTDDGATLTAELTATGGTPTTVYGYCGEDPASWTGIDLGGKAVGSVTNMVSGLDESTLYSYAFMASNAMGTVWTATNTFSTTGGKPLTANVGATGVTDHAAWLVGTLVFTGSSATAWGVVWGTNSPGATMEGWLGGGIAEANTAPDENATNSTQVTELAANTRYYFSYWATNAAGTNVAAAMSFTTHGPPAVDNDGGATDFTAVSALLRGT
jgi:hypothetical protein